MRVFFAIEFENDIKNFLYQIQNDVRQHCVSGNFTHKENFHLTLRFIGEQSQEQIEQLIISLNETAGSMYEFELKLNSLGKFDRGNKKIIWVGLQKSQNLENLYNKLERNLERIGYAKEERVYSPHVSLAREVRVENYEELSGKISVSNAAVRVKSISLMESTRINNKLCYIPIISEKLTGSIN
jgi:2'-5' RNA ligase